MKLRPVTLAVLSLLAAMSAARADDVRRPYVVQLNDKPVASYEGGIAGIGGTRPQPGSRLELDSGNAQQYTLYLSQRRAAAMALVANAPIAHEYKLVLNGFAAMLTDDEVRQLQASGQVAAVQPDTPRQLDTNYTPGFLGLDKPDGLWSKLSPAGRAGENVIVGIIDGGVWPENPAYADRVDSNGVPTHEQSGTLVYGAAPAGWKGNCQEGEGFTTAHCNNKLIGANYFNAIYLSANKVTHWSEFVSPRDSLGAKSGEGSHGTHTSSTAAGNSKVQGILGGIVPLANMSGIAPRARLATYKVCWSYDTPVTATEPYGAKNTCYQGDSVAAIEKALADGVQVLNFSISGGETVTDVVEQAFLNAANAGVFVAASGGNSGPANRVAHISPWLTTVAASSHSRGTEATLTLASGGVYKGPSYSQAALPLTDLISSANAGINGADPLAVRQCHGIADPGHTAVLDPAKVAGKIVVCERGATDRVNKGLAVQQAGGAGMVLINVAGGASDLYSDIQAVPSLHLAAASGAVVNAYAQAAGAQAALSKFVNVVSPIPAPMVTDFSSRGPNRYDPDTLKPDLTAPGKDILAGASPGLSAEQRQQVVDGTLVPPPNWVSMQGTSMSSPHVAGLAALLRNLHPTWSPAAIKSALMTTTTSAVDDGLAGDQNGLLPWAQGAGHVAPNSAFDPGLVYDLGPADYKKYQCGLGIAKECGSGSIQPYNLNLPSITASNVLASMPITRTVTNVGSTAATYSATASVDGYSTVVSPATLTLGAGESKSFTVTVTRTTAPVNAWKFGALTWSDGVHTVRSPMLLRTGKQVVAPAAVSSDRATGSRSLNLTTGYAGTISVAKGGLKEVQRTAYNVAQAVPGTVDDGDAQIAACKNGITGVRAINVSIPANTVVARFETFNRDTEGGEGHDLDLVVLNASGQDVGMSGSGGSNEKVELSSPAAGDYRVCVIGYTAADGVSSNFVLSSAVVTRSDTGGALKVLAPARVYVQGAAPVTMSWSGLEAGKRYVGGAQFLTPDGSVAATTVIAVDTDNAIPLPAAAARVVRTSSK
jgi:subtilisin family serine protease